MKIVKKLLPESVKILILKIKSSPGNVLFPAFKSSKLSSSLWYFIFSRKFGREHNAVLEGRAAYKRNLKLVGTSSVLLRRNIHRLEKGLIMKPRRSVFAEKFIEETVDTYAIAIQKGTLDKYEEKWITDVLVKYFEVVQDTRIINSARKKFSCFFEHKDSDVKFIPYQYKELPETAITYSDFNTLCTRRRSVRWYKQAEVPIELINRAVETASLAPSACNRQPYFFYVSQNKSIAVEIAKCAGGTPGWAENIPRIIVVIGDLSAYQNEKDRHLIYIDSSLAAMQLMLSFETLGLSTCCINWPDVESSERKLQNILKLESYKRPIMLISVGYAEGEGGIAYSQKKKPDELVKEIGT